MTYLTGMYVTLHDISVPESKVVFNVPFGFLLGMRKGHEQIHVLKELLFSEPIPMTSNKT